VRRTLANKRFVVTGASSGIGRELAAQLVAKGNHVLALARREERLQQLAQQLNDASGTLAYLSGDLTASDFHNRILEWTNQHWQGSVDGLINNAGIGSIGRFAESNQTAVRQVMEINFFAAVELIRALLPALRQGQQPVICNIGSVLGHAAMPGKSEYCASKFALHGFTDALRMELRAEQLDVVLVSPSTTRSEFFESVIHGAHPQTRGMSAAQVARQSLKAIERGQRERILSSGGRLLVLLDRIVPGLLSRAITSWYQRQTVKDGE
tara:strand:+ start:27953 stop:28753 length:801 start_codon:yes stop_codon:yes gene_type:complete